MGARCIAFLIAIAVLAAPAPPLRASSIPRGALGDVKVIIRGLGVKPPARPLREGKVRDPLYDAYFLRTRAREKARLQFGDGTILNVNQNTDATLRDPHHVMIAQGEIDQVDKKGSVHLIQTNAAIATALGTNYDVKIYRGKIYITVVSGLVVVSNSTGKVSVRRNQQTIVVLHRRPSRPRHVNAQAVIAWVRGLDSDGWLSITPASADRRAFSSVNGLTVGDHGHIFAGTDIGIIEFTASGHKLRTFGPAIVGGLAIDSHNIIYAVVARGSTTGIAKYSVTGHRLAFIPFPTDQSGVPLFPLTAALVVDSKGNIYVAAGGNGVVKLSPAGSVLATFKESSLSYRAVGVALDSHGNVYAAAGKGNTGYDNIVDKFSPGGQLLAHWAITARAGPSVETQSYTVEVRPGFGDIVVDSKGRIFLTAPEQYEPAIHGVTGNSAIYELTAKGALRTLWERPSGLWPAAGSFESPKCIAVDRKGNVYVGDNYRLQKLPWFDT